MVWFFFSRSSQGIIVNFSLFYNQFKTLHISLESKSIALLFMDTNERRDKLLIFLKVTDFCSLKWCFYSTVLLLLCWTAWTGLKMKVRLHYAWGCPALLHLHDLFLAPLRQSCVCITLTRLWSWACRWTALGCWRWSIRCGWPAPAAELPPSPHREGSTCCKWCLGSRLVTAGWKSPPLLVQRGRESPWIQSKRQTHVLLERTVQCSIKVFLCFISKFVSLNRCTCGQNMHM